MISDSFVNSQEWTLSRNVPEIRLGIVGSLSSGKSALVHRYLTGSYMQEESPEGGRFKKEVVVDGQSYLLLIRDEGGPPELQVKHLRHWRLIVFNFFSFSLLLGWTLWSSSSVSRTRPPSTPSTTTMPRWPSTGTSRRSLSFLLALKVHLQSFCLVLFAFCCGYLTFMRAKWLISRCKDGLLRQIAAAHSLENRNFGWWQKSWKKIGQ